MQAIGRLESRAHGPAPLSTFDVFDALLMRLADRTVLPDLTTVVIAGHSAGGQVVQRYAVVGRGDVALLVRGIYLRYVVANPSSYLYLSPDRPEKVDAASCPLLNRWRYGLEAAPPYVGATAGLETRYAARDVVYLLGTADVDPRHPDLETGCAAEAEGAYRLVRGTNYFAYMKARHPQGLVQRMALVPNVAHSGGRMFRSVCGSPHCSTGRAVPVCSDLYSIISPHDNAESAACQRRTSGIKSPHPAGGRTMQPSPFDLKVPDADIADWRPARSDTVPRSGAG